VSRHVARLVVDYFAYAARPGASARRAARHVARRRLLRLRHASGCLGTSRGSSSTTSPTPRVRVPRYVARLVTRLIVDYFSHAAPPGASARRAARHRLLQLCRASRCLGMSRGSSCGSSHRSSSTTPPHASSSLTTSPTPHVRVPRHVVWLILPLVVDYFASAARPGASARRAARHAARRRLLRLRRVSRCLGMSRGSSRRSSSTTPPRTGLSSTTSPTPRI
jgi:hypothetical protein